MFANMHQDDQDESKNRLAEVEYGGFFANPKLYYAVKEKDKLGAKMRPFIVEYDTSSFDQRLQSALEGKTEIHDQDTETAKRIRKMRYRDDIEQQNDPRIHTPLSKQDYDGDDLVIEKKE